MNVRTEQQTDRQTAQTSRLCGARSGSPQQEGFTAKGEVYACSLVSQCAHTQLVASGVSRFFHWVGTPQNLTIPLE